VATLVAMEGALWVSHRAFLGWQVQQVSQRTAEGALPEVRILAIGESTTAVAGNASNTLLVPGTAWPAQLETVLNERQDKVRFSVTNAAVMGGTSAAALDLMHDALDRDRPDMIIAMMGIMDTPGDDRGERVGLPRWLEWSRSAQLVAWLSETVRIKQSSAVKDAQTVADLPRSGRDGSLMPVGRHAFELGVSRNLVARDQIALGVFLSNTGHHARATAVLQALIEEEGVGYSALAHHFLGLDRPADALAVMEAAMAAHPEEGLYWVLRSEVEEHQGDTARSLATIAEARERLDVFTESDFIADVLTLRESSLALATGDADRAIALASSVEGEQSRRTRQLAGNQIVKREKLIGRAHMLEGRWTEAERHLLSALANQSDRAVNLMWTLTEVYRRSGQVDKEAELRQELLARTGRVGEYFELARLLRQQGHADAAEQVMDDADRQTPSLRSAYAHLYRAGAAHGAPVVVVQYPMFDLDSIHRWAPPGPGVHHVDTEDIFEGVMAESYADAGLPVAFSHYSQTGARRLAETIADTVAAAYGLP